jgi:hypothetical protein
MMCTSAVLWASGRWSCGVKYLFSVECVLSSEEPSSLLYFARNWVRKGKG